MVREPSNRPSCEETVGAGGVDLLSALSTKRVRSLADCPAGGNHVINDCDDCPFNIQILRNVFNRVGIDPNFFKIGEIAAYHLGDMAGPLNRPFVWTQDEIWTYFSLKMVGNFWH
jgi:hypothetical protein